MKQFKWLSDNFEKPICILLLSVMSILLFVQVIMRHVVGNSLTWSEELARYLFVWLVYLGISMGANERKHITVDAFMSVFPKQFRPWIIVVGDVLFLVFSVIIVVSSFDLVRRQAASGQTSVALGIPMSIVYSAPMVGFALTAVRQVQATLFHIREALYPQSGGETNV